MRSRSGPHGPGRRSASCSITGGPARAVTTRLGAADPSRYGVLVRRASSQAMTARSSAAASASGRRTRTLAARTCSSGEGSAEGATTATTVVFTRSTERFSRGHVRDRRDHGAMATGAIEARYDGHAEFYDRLFAAYTDPTDSPGADLAQLLGPPSDDGWVLDVCCGGGLSGRALAAAGWRVHGIDISADQLRLAVPRLGGVAQADAHRPPVPSGSIGHARPLFAHH